jgi:hypothetical protein
LSVALLKGQRLDGARLCQLATEFQSALPPAVRSVSFFAERAGDGNGFNVSIGFVAGEVSGQTGWEREMSVRHGDRNVYNQGGYTREGAIRTENIYGGMKEAFEQAVQRELNAPVTVRFRLQRKAIQ